MVSYKSDLRISAMETAWRKILKEKKTNHSAVEGSKQIKFWSISIYTKWVDKQKKQVMSYWAVTGIISLVGKVLRQLRVLLLLWGQGKIQIPEPNLSSQFLVQPVLLNQSQKTFLGIEFSPCFLSAYSFSSKRRINQ